MADDALLNVRITGDSSAGVAATKAMQDQITQLQTKVSELEAQLASAGGAQERFAASSGRVENALAQFASRAAGAEAGLGMMGGALGRVATAAGAAGPLLAAAIPLVAIVGAIKLFDDYRDHIIALANDQSELNQYFAKENDVLLEQQERLAGITGGPLAEYAKQLQDVGLKSADISPAIEKANKLLKEQNGYWMAIKDNANRAALAIAAAGEAEGGNVPAEQPKQYNENDSNAFLAQLQLRVTQTNDLKAALASAGAELNKIHDIENSEQAAGLNTERTENARQAVQATYEALVQKFQQAEGQKTNIAAESAKKYQDILDNTYEQGVQDTQRYVTEDERALNQRLEAEKAAQRALDEIQKGNAEEEKKDAREAQDAWAAAARARIEQEAEASRKTQEDFQVQLRQVEELQSAQQANVSKGPFTQIFDSAGIAQQLTIANAAMQEAKQQAADYQAQLDLVKDAMSEVNTKTEEGAKAFRDLQQQEQALQRLMDGATVSASKWQSVMDQVTNKAAHDAQTFEQAWKSAANNTTTAFNNSFLQWAEHGGSAMKILQSMGQAAFTTLGQYALKETELKVGEWLKQALFKKAIDTTNASTGAAAQIAAAKTVAVAQAGVAGAAGVASWAAAPWPIDSGAPAFGAAMQSAALSFAAFEHGGIVPETQMALVHKNEMVLPAHIASGVQSAFAPGQSGGAGAALRPVSFNPTFNIHGDFDPAVHGPQMMDYFKGQLRRMGKSF